MKTGDLRLGLETGKLQITNKSLRVHSSACRETATSQTWHQDGLLHFQTDVGWSSSMGPPERIYRREQNLTGNQIQEQQGNNLLIPFPFSNQKNCFLSRRLLTHSRTQIMKKSAQLHDAFVTQCQKLLPQNLMEKHNRPLLYCYCLLLFIVLCI